MNESTATQNHKATIDESLKDNKNDQRYISCTHIDKEWGKDFAGTNEPVALCTPPWHVLREALFGIVQSIKDDEELSNDNENENGNRNTNTIAPVDIAYVVVVNASARVKKNNPRPRRRNVLSTSILSKLDTNTVLETTIVTSIPTTEYNDHVNKLDHTSTPSTFTVASEQPKYKLFIDDDANDESDTNDNQLVDDTNTNVMRRSMAATLNVNVVSPSMPQNAATTSSLIAEMARPRFRLCYD